MYAYDGVGNPIVTRIDSNDAAGRKASSTKNGHLRTYTNDAINRQIGTAIDGAYASFVYDRVGNVLVKWQPGDWPRTST